MENIIKIALAEDEVLFREAISFLLKSNKNFKIVFEASNGHELITFLESSATLPDIVILDIKMPLLNGIEAAKIIRNEFPDIKIIALSSYHSQTFISHMISTGASSFLIKNTTPEILSKTIYEVYQKGYYYTDEVLEVIRQVTLSNKTAKTKLILELTKRELEILKLICQQNTTAEIADKLFLSVRTVEGHKNNLLQKTECKNVVSLVIYAIQNEFVDLNEFL
jgi:DNA-binding NarL/FixJ family response regulator